MGTIIKVKTVKGKIFTHHFEGTLREWKKIMVKSKNVIYPSSNRDYVRYGGKPAKVISMREAKLKSQVRRSMFGMPSNASITRGTFD